MLERRLIETENFNLKIINATKWSAITEFTAKIISPVTNMILARIVAPEAFGVVATITMIISFVDMFTDAGFQKYLVQHEFKNEDEKSKNANVAFWTNLIISVFLWFWIIVFSEEIASLVGNPGFGNIISISCVQLLLTSFSSIQIALYKRDFDFKTLFIVRIVSVCIPLFITIPLALLGLSYWALILGSIFIKVINIIILTVKSKWKPYLFYEFEVLKEMFSFSIWSLVEAISIWFTIWVDAFFIGNSFNQYYLGIYKTSTSMVNSLMALITSSTVPVLFSALSRLQNNTKQFNELYLKMQRLVSIFVFPLGIGVCLYSELATKILLGSKWEEASSVIGVWALTSALMIVFGHFCSEVYRAKGRPKLSLLAQLLHLVVLVPVCIVSSNYGFWYLVYARCWIRLQAIIVHFLLMKFVIGISVLKTIKNLASTALSAIAMALLGILLSRFNTGLLWDLESILICSLFYLGILYLFPGMRKELNEVFLKLKPKLKKGGVLV